MSINYRMTEINRLDIDVIKAQLKSRVVGKNILVYESTSSTNDIAWEYAGGGNNNGLSIFAELQNAGRGRMGNEWLSGRSESVLCSVLLCAPACGAELLALAAAVAVAESVNAVSGLETTIKWPNDVMVNAMKIAGVLLESRINGPKNDYVIGIGINCHQKSEFFTQAKLHVPATSIDVESGNVTDRNLLAGALLNSLDYWLGVAESDSDGVVERWRQLSSQLGHHIVVQYNRQQFSGNCIGVDPSKGLILQLDKGGVRMFDAAHTTIVKHL